MKISTWDILSIFLLLATAIVLLVVFNIYSNPYGGLNPFPPPTLPSSLVLPTYTNTPLRLPATWTPGSSDSSGPTSTAGSNEPGLHPTWTPLPTPTGFQVATWTPTFTMTYTPTETLTPTNTRTITPIPPTSTPTSNKTATYQVLQTQLVIGQTGTAAVKTADAVGTSSAATKTAAAVATTAVPPTAVPPTAVPPTSVPTTAIPYP
jgi:hypothetical protein